MTWFWLEKREYDSARQYDRHTQPERTYGLCIKIPPLIDACTWRRSDATQQKKREDDDLAAQQEMADWAFWVALVSVPGLMLSFGGLALIYATLQKTSEAIVVSDRNSRDETRAYVHAEGADVTWGDRKAPVPIITVHVKNSGQSPARWFSARTAVFIRELNEDGVDTGDFEFSSIDFSGRNQRTWNSLGAGAELSFTAFDESEVSEISEAYGKHLALHVAGVIQYETYFGEVFESEFWFTRRPIPRYQEKVLSHSERGGVVVTETEEISRKLQRVSCKLRTYVKVSAS